MLEDQDVTYHSPVLLKQAVDGLQIHEDGIYVDVTFGGGGHSMASGITIKQTIGSKGLKEIFIF